MTDQPALMFSTAGRLRCDRCGRDLEEGGGDLYCSPGRWLTCFRRADLVRHGWLRKTVTHEARRHDTGV